MSDPKREPPSPRSASIVELALATARTAADGDDAATELVTDLMARLMAREPEDPAEASKVIRLSDRRKGGPR